MLRRGFAHFALVAVMAAAPAQVLAETGVTETTIAIGALKIYDIVAVMTGGRNDSTVLAFEMVNQQQRFQSYGHSSALAVVLFIFVLPLIIYNARSMRKQREIR